MDFPGNTMQDLLKNVVYRVENIDPDNVRLISVPTHLHQKALDSKKALKNDFNIDVCEFQPHALNGFSYDIDLSWKVDTLNLKALKKR